MLNPRLLLLFPMFLLGSCNALSPQVSINIITSETPRGTEVQSVAGITLPNSHLATPTLTKEDKCKVLELAELNSYVLPPLPNPENIPTNNPNELMGILFDVIDAHRAEIKRLQAAYKCTLQGR